VMTARDIDALQQDLNDESRHAQIKIRSYLGKLQSTDPATISAFWHGMEIDHDSTMPPVWSPKSHRILFGARVVKGGTWCNMLAVYHVKERFVQDVFSEPASAQDNAHFHCAARWINEHEFLWVTGHRVSLEGNFPDVRLGKLTCRHACIDPHEMTARWGHSFFGEYESHGSEEDESSPLLGIGAFHTCSRFSPDGQFLAVAFGDYDEKQEMQDTSKEIMREVLILKLDGTKMKFYRRICLEETSACHLDWSPDSCQLVATGVSETDKRNVFCYLVRTENEVDEWGIEHPVGYILANLPDGRGPSPTTQFSPCGNYLATCNLHGNIGDLHIHHQLVNSDGRPVFVECQRVENIFEELEKFKIEISVSLEP